MFRSGKKADSAVAKVADWEHSGFTMGFVYANELARNQIEEPNPRFPAGSIIVRERFDSITATKPSVVIAMVKRERGFSKDTGDWEFLVLNGADLELRSRETTGRCAECHAGARRTDWIFLGRHKN